MKCEHFTSKQCDCLKGNCFSFQTVDDFYSKIKPVKKRTVTVNEKQKARSKELAPRFNGIK